MNEAFWDSKPWFRVGPGGVVPTPAQCVLAGVRNIAGSGLVLRVRGVTIRPGPTTGYAGVVQPLFAAVYPDAANGTDEAVTSMDNTVAVPATTLVKGVKGAATLGVATCTVVSVILQTASVNQVAGAASWPIYARNLLELQGIRGVLVRPGQMLAMLGTVDEPGGSLYGSVVFQVSDEEPTDMSAQMDTLNGHLADLVAAQQAQEQALLDLRLNERTTHFVDQYGNEFWHEQYGI